jgi:hypothetical protein
MSSGAEAERAHFPAPGCAAVGEYPPAVLKGRGFLRCVRLPVRRSGRQATEHNRSTLDALLRRWLSVHGDVVNGLPCRGTLEGHLRRGLVGAAPDR